MYQLLKRKSLNVSEFVVYKILKEYFICLIGKEQEVFKPKESQAVIDLFRELVDFSKCSLKEIDILGEEGWFPKGMFFI